MTRFQLAIIKQVVDSGGIIAYPTEGVFGLGCRPDDYIAVKNILKIKKRPAAKGLILIASNIRQILPFIVKPHKSTWSKMTETWPGHISWAIAASDSCPAWIKGENPTVVVRVSKHPVVRAICNTLGYAIVSTSANISSQVALDNALKVRKALGDRLDLIVPGATLNRKKPSSIFNAQDGKQLR